MKISYIFVMFDFSGLYHSTNIAFRVKFALASAAQQRQATYDRLVRLWQHPIRRHEMTGDMPVCFRRDQQPRRAILGIEIEDAVTSQQDEVTVLPLGETTNDFGKIDAL